LTADAPLVFKANGWFRAKQPFGDSTLSPLMEGKTEIAKRWLRGFGPFAAVGVGKAISKREILSRSQPV
jgi:hypothetical protein